MANNIRVFYATHAVGIKTDGVAGNFNILKGVQSVGMTANFNLSQVFQLGMIEIYQNVEDIPDVQVTISKVLDGNPLIYHEATKTATTPTLVGRSTIKCLIALGIYPDSNTHANGLASAQVTTSGMFPSSINYTFPVDDNSQENLTFVGNHRVWSNDTSIVLGAPTINFSGTFVGTEVPLASGGVSRRQHVTFDTTLTGASASGDANGYLADPDCTILPSIVKGISSSGINLSTGSTGRSAHVQSISVSADLGREAINELGQKAPYTRYATFPIQVTTEITVVTSSGDFVSANEVGILSSGTSCGQDRGNLANSTIRIATCEGTRVYCGLKNKLQSVNYTGGDTGGGNVNVTYSFSTFNDLTVMHVNDPNSSGGFSWANRAIYLVNA